MEKLKKEVPACILSAVARSWLNGWCTSRRFQQGTGNCWLSEDCGGDDSLEHYAMCPWSWRASCQRLKIDDSHRCLGRFLLLEPRAHEDVVLLALNLYAVYITRNAFKARGRRGQGDEPQQKIKASYTQAALLCPRLAKRLRMIWST